MAMMEMAKEAMETFQRNRTLDYATSTAHEVTPLYLLDEVCTMTRTGGSAISRKIVEHLERRLEHRSPVVKQKALRVIKYVCVKGDASFRREMQRRAAPVRELVTYTGVPDELRGDALNKAVRETAKEAVAAIFDSGEQQAAAAAPDSLAAKGRIQGFGSGNAGGIDGGSSGSSYGSSESRIKGFSSAGPRALGSSGFSSLSGGGTGGGTGGGGGGGGGSGGGGGGFSTRYSPPTHRRSGSLSKPWAGGSVDDDGDSGDYARADDAAGAYARQTSASSAASGMAAVAAVPGFEESRLVAGITAPGGVRPQPSKEALQSFIQAALKLDGDTLARELQEKLAVPNWQVRLKAVCVVEAVVRFYAEQEAAGGSAGGLDRIVRYFQEYPDTILVCAESPQATLRERSNKLLPMLAGGEAALGESSPAQAASAPVGDLLDFGDAAPSADAGVDGGGAASDPFGVDDRTSSAHLGGGGGGGGGGLMGGGATVQNLFGGMEPVGSSSTPAAPASDPFAEALAAFGGDANVAPAIEPPADVSPVDGAAAALTGSIGLEAPSASAGPPPLDGAADLLLGSGEPAVSDMLSPMPPGSADGGLFDGLELDENQAAAAPPAAAAAALSTTAATTATRSPVATAVKLGEKKPDVLADLLGGFSLSSSGAPMNGGAKSQPAAPAAAPPTQARRAPPSVVSGGGQTGAPGAGVAGAALLDDEFLGLAQPQPPPPLTAAGAPPVLASLLAQQPQPTLPQPAVAQPAGAAAGVGPPGLPVYGAAAAGAVPGMAPMGAMPMFNLPPGYAVVPIASLGGAPPGGAPLPAVAAGPGVLAANAVPGLGGVNARAGVELPPTPKKPDAFDFVADHLSKATSGGKKP